MVYELINKISSDPKDLDLFVSKLARWKVEKIVDIINYIASQIDHGFDKKVLVEVYKKVAVVDVEKANQLLNLAADSSHKN